MRHALASLAIPFAAPLLATLGCSLSVDGDGLFPSHGNGGSSGTAGAGDTATDGGPRAACSAGCEPVLVAPLVGAPLAADSHGLYALPGDGTVVRLAKTAGAAPVTVATGIHLGVSELALDTTSIYLRAYGSPTQVLRVPRDGGTPVMVTAASAPASGAGPLVVGSVELFFRTDDGAIVGIPKGAVGGNVATWVTAPTGNAPFLVDATSITWASDGALQRRALAADAEAHERIARLGVVTALAADAQAFYAVTGDATIARVPRDGGAPTILVTAWKPEELATTRLLVDATSVTWLSPTAGRIFRAPKEGGAYAPIAALAPREAPWSLTADDDAIYWSDADGVHRVAK